MAWRKNRRIRVTRYFAHFTNGIARPRDIAENRLFGERMIHDMGTIIDRPVSESSYERYRIGRGIGDASVPDHQGSFQAVAADLRQADDLLSSVGSDAGRNPGHSGDLHAVGPVLVPAAARRRVRLRGPSLLCRAAVSRRARSGVSDRRGVHRGRGRMPRSGRQHLSGGGLSRSAAGGRRHGRAGGQGNRFRVPGRRSPAIRRGRVRRERDMPLDRGEARAS